MATKAIAPDCPWALPPDTSVHALRRIINTRVIETNDAFEENNGAFKHDPELC